MPLLNTDLTNHHAVVYAVADGPLKAADAEYGIGSTTETLTGEHRTTITFTRGGGWTQPVLDALEAELEPKGYKVWREGMDVERIVVMHPRPNFMVVIGYQGNKRGYINVPMDEAKRRWLASENKGAPADCIKTEVDEPVETVWFHDELEIY